MFLLYRGAEMQVGKLKIFYSHLQWLPDSSFFGQQIFFRQAKGRGND